MKAYAERHGRRSVVVAGGVAANKTVRATLESVATKHGFAFLAPPMAYCTDNAAMIALAGAERLQRG
jgi:N6-L-threonylcarbamoyladenine synthase